MTQPDGAAPGPAPVGRDPWCRPADHGLLAWNFDPTDCDASSGVQPSANGHLFQMALRLDAPAIATGLACSIFAAGATLTAGQCLLALYDAAGNRVGLSADQSSAWTSTGAKLAALTFTLAWLPAGEYYAEFLANGTTRPTFASKRQYHTGPATIGRTLATARAGANLSAGATAMPATKPAATSYWTPIWCALY